MSRFTPEELADGLASLLGMGIKARHDDMKSYNGGILLGYLGQVIGYALIDHPDSAQLRHAAAVYEIWKGMPEVAEVELPLVFDDPTDDQLAEVLEHLRVAL